MINQPLITISIFTLLKLDDAGHKEYVASLIGLYKNNGAVLNCGIKFLSVWALYQMHPGTLLGCNKVRRYSWTGIEYGQILIGTATYSLLQSFVHWNRMDLVDIHSCYLQCIVYFCAHDLFSQCSNQFHTGTSGQC